VIINLLRDEEERGFHFSWESLWAFFIGMLSFLWTVKILRTFGLSRRATAQQALSLSADAV